jgi:hypothetical protein
MDHEEKELLAEFHHTISEQLNARLSESPKFFGLLIVVSTGCGYVLSEPKLCKFITLATVLSLAATLWATWYLAALGYAFRFLQNIQHRIEHALEWSRCTLDSGNPPESLWYPWKWFWLLPGIYHAHAAGICFLFVLVCVTGFAGRRGIVVSVIGVSVISLVNWCYLKKFKRTRKKP